MGRGLHTSHAAGQTGQGQRKGMTDNANAGKEKGGERTNLSVLDMELTGEPPRSQVTQEEMMSLLQEVRTEQKLNNQAMRDTLSSLERAFIMKQDQGVQVIQSLLERHVEYVREQVADTSKWRMQQNNTEILQVLRGTVSPISEAIRHLRAKVTACTTQLRGVAEEVTALEPHTLHPIQLSLSSAAVQTDQEGTSPKLPPVDQGRLRLQSTMHLGENLPEVLPSPFGVEQRGRFAGKCPVKVQFPCFGRMEDVVFAAVSGLFVTAPTYG